MGFLKVNKLILEDHTFKQVLPDTVLKLFVKYTLIFEFQFLSKFLSTGLTVTG